MIDHIFGASWKLKFFKAIGFERINAFFPPKIIYKLCGEKGSERGKKDSHLCEDILLSIWFKQILGVNLKNGLLCSILNILR